MRTAPQWTPNHMFVDDDIYAEVYDVERIKRSCAAGIESIMIILGESYLEKTSRPYLLGKAIQDGNPIQK